MAASIVVASGFVGYDDDELAALGDHEVTEVVSCLVVAFPTDFFLGDVAGEDDGAIGMVAVQGDGDVSAGERVVVGEGKGAKGIGRAGLGNRGAGAFVNEVNPIASGAEGDLGGCCARRGECDRHRIGIGGRPDDVPRTACEEAGSQEEGNGGLGDHWWTDRRYAMGWLRGQWRNGRSRLSPSTLKVRRSTLNVGSQISRCPGCPAVPLDVKS